jgi:hypothetical protein
MKQVKDKLPEKDTEQQIISHQPMINPLSCLWWEAMTASDTKSTAHPSQPPIQAGNLGAKHRKFE